MLVDTARDTLRGSDEKRWSISSSSSLLSAVTTERVFCEDDDTPIVGCKDDDTVTGGFKEDDTASEGLLVVFGAEEPNKWSMSSSSLLLSESEMITVSVRAKDRSDAHKEA